MKKPMFKKRHQSEEMALQITSMADIFTILLVFLLKSYATSAITVNPAGGMLLPQAQAGEAAIEALKIEVSEKSISVEGKPVTPLDHFAPAKADLLASGASVLLSKALEKERARELLIAKANSDVKVDAKIIIIADSRAPYSTIKSVLASAAQSGYTDYKLAVIRGD
jgi:biopolymer transport protein ExbD